VTLISASAEMTSRRALSPSRMSLKWCIERFICIVIFFGEQASQNRGFVPIWKLEHVSFLFQGAIQAGALACFGIWDIAWLWSLGFAAAGMGYDMALALTKAFGITR
jgi:hypothetical protein